jgi:hypothetical protein
VYELPDYQKTNGFLRYVIGSSRREITVDGAPDDWGSIIPLVTFPSKSISPPEAEPSNIYVANDEKNLYFRFDVRDKPNTTTSRAELGRGISVFINTDNNYTTGSYGADFALSLDFCTGSYNGTGKSSVAWYYKWTGTGMGKLQEKGVLTNSSDFNNVFELKIPLSVLNVNTGQTIDIYISTRTEPFSLYRIVPYIYSYLTYPPDTTPPVTAIAFQPTHQPASKTYVSGSTVFTLSANDDASGVREIKYRIDGGAWNTYTKGLTLSTLPDGEHTISYYSVDNTGNNETEKTLTIILDKSPPTIS